MKTASLLALGPILAVSSTTLSAQSIVFPDFQSATGITTNGVAGISGPVLRMVSGANGVGSAWLDTQVPVVAGFDAQFVFRVPNPAAVPEGLAFVIHLDSGGTAAIGSPAQGLGYAGGAGGSGAAIANSIAIEFDMQRQNSISDQFDREISVHTQGVLDNDENESASIARANSPIDFADGAPHTVGISYVPGTLEIFIDDSANPVLVANYDFTTGGILLLGAGVGGLNLPAATAFIGFAASSGTGSSQQQIDVLSWAFDTAGGVPCFAGTVGTGAGGNPIDMIRVNGTVGDFFRRVRAPSFDPVSIEIDSPLGSAPAPFLLFLSTGAADGSMTVPSPWGEFCFSSLNPTTAIPFMAPETIDVPAGLGLIGDFTLQGLISEDPMTPGMLAVTNAVVLEFVPQPPVVIEEISPSSGVAGDPIALSGSGFSAATVVDVDSIVVIPTSVTSTQIVFDVPAGVGCDAVVTVTNFNAQFATVDFNSSPSINNVVNDSGPAAGGTTLVIIGERFVVGSTVMVNGGLVVPNTIGPSVITLTTPPGPVGPAPVDIVTPAGCSVSTTFTYQ